MDFVQSVILGAVEGFTEFLPISSTAHLILTAKVLVISQTEFTKTFEIAIQSGAILAVVWLYGKRFFLDGETVKKIIVAFLPTAVLGLLLYKILKGILLENIWITVLALFLGGIFLIMFELWHKVPTPEEARDPDQSVGGKTEAGEDVSKIPYWQCLLIGTFQSVAIIPGVSRAGATIIGGLFLGLSRKTIVEFSFLLAVPTMLAATSYDLLKTGANFSSEQFAILAVGFVVSFLVAIAAIKFLLRYIQKNNFIWFGVYRIIISLLFLLWLI